MQLDRIKLALSTVANDWIPTTERQPEKDGEYLVVFQCQRTVLERKEGHWLWGDGTPMYGAHNRDVTHWQQLPPVPTHL